MWLQMTETISQTTQLSDEMLNLIFKVKPPGPKLQYFLSATQNCPFSEHSLAFPPVSLNKPCKFIPITQESVEWCYKEVLSIRFSTAYKILTTVLQEQWEKPVLITKYPNKSFKCNLTSFHSSHLINWWLKL